MADAKPKGWNEGHAAAMVEVAQALGVEAVTLDDLRAMAELLDERDAAPTCVEGVAIATDDAGRPVPIYAWAIWREPSGMYRRARMHPPLEVVLRHKVGEVAPPDFVSRVVPQIERDLVSETLNKGIRWEP